MDLQHPSHAPLRVELLANPSHLEAVNPLAVGRTRALHRAAGVGGYGDSMQGAAVCLQVCSLRIISHNRYISLFIYYYW